MGLPKVGLAWLAVLLHENGHARQYRLSGNSVVPTVELMEDMRFLLGDGEVLDIELVNGVLRKKK